MARQPVVNGSFADDPSAEGLYTAFNKVNANEAELYTLFLGGEYLSTGVLVYPSGAAQTMSYNADSTVASMTCTYGGYTWTMAYTYTDGNVTQMDADNGAGGSSWSRTLTYNADSTLNTDGGWA